MEIANVSPALQERLGPEATTGLLELLETARQEWTADVTTAAVEQFERRLTEATASVRQEMRDLGAALRQDLRDGDMSIRLEMRDLAATLKADNLKGRFELVKWLFVFWVGQAFVVAGIVAVMLQLMR